MVRHKNFQGLKSFAEKEMKFNQGKPDATSYLRPGAILAGNIVNHVEWGYDDYAAHMSGGVCMGLVSHWLQEKIKSSNSIFNFQPKDFSVSKKDSVNQEKIGQLMKKGGGTHLLYATAGGVDEKAALQAVGLKIDEADLAGEASIKNLGDNIPSVDIAESFANICASAVWKQGTGLCISVDIRQAGIAKRSGHAVAAYKSKGGHLYFFDPNVGVYKLRKPREFLGAWLDAYAGLGRTVSMSRENFKAVVAS